MRDLLADEYILYQNVFDKAEEIASYYGFQAHPNSAFGERRSFYRHRRRRFGHRGKADVLCPKRRGQQSCLRPEGTAPVMRAYIEHGLHTLPQPVMLWYKGSFFPPRKSPKGPVQGIFPIRFGNNRRRQADRRSDDYPNFHPGAQRTGTRSDNRPYQFRWRQRMPGSIGKNLSLITESICPISAKTASGGSKKIP